MFFRNMVADETQKSAIAYEVELLEREQNDGSDLSDTRSHRAFTLMKHLIPLMGVHRKQFEIIYTELYRSVFSDELTTQSEGMLNHKGETAVKNLSHVDRQAYFTLYGNLKRSRDDKAESLELYIESLVETLKEKEALILEQQQQITMQEAKINLLENEKVDLESKLVDLTDTITKLDTNFKEFVAQKDVSDLHYEDEILNLQNDLNSATVELERVEKFESLYKELDKDFAADEMQVSKMDAQIVPASNKNSVLVDLKSSQALERQLLTVQNSLIEEFDQYMEEYRERLENATLAKNSRDPNYEKDEKMLAHIDRELAEKQKVFKRTIEDVEDELEMLKIHRENLEINRDRIKHEEEEKARDMALKRDKKGKDPGVSKGPEEENEVQLTPSQKAALDTVFDKLDAQEQITSKYSSIIYFSNNRGRTFYELPQNSLCNSCGTTTMICPHKIAKQDWVIELPSNTQMLRISRPKLKLQKKLDDREIEALFSKQLKEVATQQSSITATGAAPSTVKEQNEGGEEDAAGSAENALDTEAATASEGAELEGESKVATEIEEDLQDDALYFSRIKDIQEGLAPISQKLDSQFEWIWKDFRKRTAGFLRLIPRHISEERVVSLVEQFLANVLWQDRSYDTENVPSVVDSLYIFFKDRFLLGKMSHCTLFDFFNSLQYFAKNNIVLLSFVQCLSGDMDFSQLRSLVYLGQLIKMIEWNSIQDLYWFIHIAYPFLPSEECDNLVLDYVSFSKNSLSAELVMHFLFYITLKQREPRASNSEIRLCQFPSAEPGVMTDMEFAVAVNELIHMHSVPLRTRLFKQALQVEKMSSSEDGSTSVMNTTADGSSPNSTKNGVAFETILHVTAYLDLLDEFETAKKRIAEQDRSQRQVEYPEGLKIKVVSNKNPIISAENLLKMANNFSQRERSRVMRQMQASIEKATGGSSK